MMMLGVFAYDDHKYIRLHANGYYLRYMTEYEHGNADATQRYVEEVNTKCHHQVFCAIFNCLLFLFVLSTVLLLVE